MKGAVALSLGFLLALGVRSARAEAPAGSPSPAPSGSMAGAPAAPTQAEPADPGGPASPAAAPPAAPATITVGMPQPTVRPISQDIGIGVALTYVSIPLVLLSGGVLGVGYLVDSDGVKVAGFIMTGSSLALFGVGVGFLVAGSEQGPQPQRTASAGRAPSDHGRRPAATPYGTTMVVPVLSGSF